MSLAWEGIPIEPPEPLPEDPSQPDESTPARNFRLWREWWYDLGQLEEEQWQLY